uniref:Uncharacterized protein n=1 Tax=Plectus sambesii TaxID=2011161 RepID=A0A914WN08_9BILA
MVYPRYSRGGNSRGGPGGGGDGVRRGGVRGGSSRGVQGIIRGSARGNAQNTTRDRQPLPPPRPDPGAPTVPLTAEETGAQQLAGLLAFADTIRTQSSRWRIGARRTLQVQDAPNARGLIELLDAAEREGTLRLASLVERALLARYEVERQRLAQLRDLNAQAAAMAVAPPQPVPPEQLAQQLAAFLQLLQNPAPRP